MNVSLAQAIEIHARVLKRRANRDAPAKARQRADDLHRAGDKEGRNVWLSVAAAAERLLGEDSAQAEKIKSDQ